MQKTRLKEIYDDSIFTPELTGGFLLLLFLSLISANPLLTFYALISFLLIVNLLWRKGEAPIFVFIAAYQWIQASAKIFHANVYGIPIEEFQTYPGTETAIWLSITGVIVLSIGIHLALLSLPLLTPQKLKEELRTVDINRLFVMYIVVFVSVFILDKFKFAVPQLSQILISFLQIKWVVFFVLVVKILLENAKLHYIITVIVIEVIIGFSGYFASFKEVFFYFFVTFLTVRYRLNARSLVPIALAFGVLFLLALFWTGVKDEYRKFVRAGEIGQVVRVSNNQKVEKFKELYSRYDSRHLKISFDAMLERLAYVDFFGATINFVPDYRPHTKGDIWKGALAHIFMPRLFFPDKPVLPSDSEHTMKYTGIILASGSQGVSFSIGYMGDSFIDFGFVGMFVPIFLLGLLWGRIYQLFLRQSKYKLTGMAFAMIVLMGTYQLERASVKLLGTIIMSFLVTFTLMWFLEQPFYRFLNPEAGEEELKLKKEERKSKRIKKIRD